MTHRTLRNMGLLAVLLLVGTTAVSVVLGQTVSWLDLPLSAWNKPGAAILTAPAGTESREALTRRCGGASAPKISTVAAAALAKSGWTPFLHQDQQIQRESIEVVAGMSAAAATCDATTFNLFLFVEGVYAGTLSPVTMTTARDGVIRAVRVTGSDTLTAEFARYKPSDPECCSSSRLRVTYKIGRADGRPSVAATEIRPIQ